MKENRNNHRTGISGEAAQDNSAYEKYLEQMKELKEKDRQNMFDNDERKKGLSNNEQIYAHIMEMERSAIIANKYIYRDYPPANMFYDGVREKIEQTYSFELLRDLPKGGNLHIHTSSTWDAKSMLEYFAGDGDLNKNIYVYLGDDMPEMKLVNGELLYIKNISAVKDKKISSGLKLLKDLTYEETAKEISLITFGDEKRINDVDYIWDEFNNVFSRVRYIINVRKIYRTYYREAFKTLCEDNLDYTELRFGVSELCDNNDKLLQAHQNVSAADERDYTEKYKECLDEIMAAYHECRDYKDKYGNTPYKDFKLKLIISASRKSADFTDIKNLMMATGEWEKNYRDSDGSRFVVGFDFVSEEDLNYKTDFYAKAIFENHMEDIGFYFHDGESNWADDDNVISAVCLNTKRIGHGFNIYRFPAAVEKVINDKICLEVCPVSNQLLRYAPDLRIHPMGEYIKRGVPITICSDDPQIFNDKGLTYDFWEFYFSQLADMYSIKQAVRNSYIYSAMDETEKREAIENWENKWNKTIDSYVPNNIIACAAMFDRHYYDKIKNTKDQNAYFDLTDEDKKLWTESYRDLLKAEGIPDGEFFKGSDLNPNVGIGADGNFNKFEYCNIMYQLFRYLVKGKDILVEGVREKDVENVYDYLNSLDKYVDRIKGCSPKDNTVYSLEGDDMTLWQKKYYPYISKTNIISDGTFWGDTLSEPNLGIGKDGKFTGRELLHFLFECYKFIFFNKPWDTLYKTSDELTDC